MVEDLGYWEQKIAQMLRIVFFSLLFTTIVKCKNEVTLPYYNTPDFTPIFLNKHEAKKLIYHSIADFEFDSDKDIKISKKTLKNRIFSRIIEKAYIDIQAGNPIHKSLDRESVIPVMFTSMFRIGEETGELSEMITKLADFYEDEVSSSVKSLTSIMEPLMIIFVAVFASCCCCCSF